MEKKDEKSGEYEKIVDKQSGESEENVNRLLLAGKRVCHERVALHFLR